MFNIAKNSIHTSKLGHPVMIGEVVGRIVGYPEDSANYVDNDGEKQYSQILLGTPHGSVITSGRLHVSEITPEGMEKLLIYEEELRYEFKPLYNGLLDDILPKDTETYAAKLRNAISPIYGLSEMIILTDENSDKKEEMWSIIVEAAKQAEKNKNRVDKLLFLIDKLKT